MPRALCHCLLFPGAEGAGSAWSREQYSTRGAERAERESRGLVNQPWVLNDRWCLLYILRVCLKVVNGLSLVNAFPLSRRAIMSAAVRKGFYRMPELKAQFPEQQ